MIIRGYDLTKEALAAEQRIRSFIRETPVEYSPFLSQLGNCEVHLKLENLQLTGSFKIRGAANAILSLSKQESQRRIVAASSGNHGAGVAHLVDKLGLQGTIYLPENAPEAKVDGLRFYKVSLEFHGTDVVETEQVARTDAEKQGSTIIPPYNHPRIIAGQATVAIELQRQLDSIDAVLVPVGGGGLISGMAGYLKSLNKNVRIIGCQPENSPVMYESIRAGKIIEMVSKPTLADGTAGGIEAGALTFDICRETVDEFVLVSEDEIKQAILLILDKHHLLVEGAAALTVAAFIKLQGRLTGQKVVLIISGRKISVQDVKQFLCR